VVETCNRVNHLKRNKYLLLLLNDNKCFDDFLTILYIYIYIYIYTYLLACLLTYLLTCLLTYLLTYSMMQSPS